MVHLVYFLESIGTGIGCSYTGESIDNERDVVAVDGARPVMRAYLGCVKVRQRRICTSRSHDI